VCVCVLHDWCAGVHVTHVCGGRAAVSALTRRVSGLVLRRASHRRRRRGLVSRARFCVLGAAAAVRARAHVCTAARSALRAAVARYTPIMVDIPSSARLKVEIH